MKNGDLFFLVPDYRGRAGPLTGPYKRSGRKALYIELNDKARGLPGRLLIYRREPREQAA